VSAGARKSKNMGDLPQWDCGGAELREGKAPKVPLLARVRISRPLGRSLHVGTLTEAKRTAREGDYDGIGSGFLARCEARKGSS
jgi:hypothetical protein